MSTPEPPRPLEESNVRGVYTLGGEDAGGPTNDSGRWWQHDRRTFRERIYNVTSDTEASQLDAWLDLLNSIRVDTNVRGSTGKRNIRVPLADYDDAVATATADELAGKEIWARGNPEVKFT